MGPELHACGKGWKRGWVSNDEVKEALARAKIGLNVHNSVGPVNLRTYTLPANGVMQICDNRFFLGHLFELGKEVIGFCDIEEVPDLARFYLRNDRQRKEIALQGWERANSEYNEIAVWRKQMETIAKLL